MEMKNIGVAQGDVVSVCSVNNLDVCVPFIAAMFLGAKTVNMDVGQPVEDLQRIIRDFAPKIIFASNDAEEKLMEAARETILVIFGSASFSEFLRPKPDEEQFRPLQIGSIDDIAHVFFSSGTTGQAKGINISHKALLNQTEKLM